MADACSKLSSVSSIRVVLLAGVGLVGGSAAADGGCPDGMASVGGRFCIDRWEASLALVDDQGHELGPHSPFEVATGDVEVAARTRPGVHPQAHVSARVAAKACERAGKRLCSKDEWLTACRGRQPTRYPYGVKHRPGYCNDDGVSPIGILRGARAGGLDYAALNDKRLNQVPGSLARTGTFNRCQNEYGVSDMVGNLHEWTAEGGGVFRGGFYLDTRSLGEGCDYNTHGHDLDYRDYSTGFRCCADP